MKPITFTCLLLLALAGGCDDSTTPGTDGGTTPGMDSSTVLPDGRVVPTPDSGGVDTGPGGCVPTFEICGDHVDQNCDGRDTSCGNTDGDFFDACRPGEAPPACDCDDSMVAVYPGAPEICNSLDDDCDGRVDEVAACCAACTGMAERADTCTPAGDCVCSTEGAGDAVCPAGRSCCTAGCVDTQTDLMNCGGCNSLCTTQSDRCAGGSCMCGSGPPCDRDIVCGGGGC
jgi:hypothetical protein